MAVLDKRLEGRIYLVGEEYSIADISIFPWIGYLSWDYNAAEILDLNRYKNISAWYERCISRPASIRGAKVCPF